MPEPVSDALHHAPTTTMRAEPEPPRQVPVYTETTPGKHIRPWTQWWRHRRARWGVLAFAAIIAFIGSFGSMAAVYGYNPLSSTNLSLVGAGLHHENGLPSNRACLPLEGLPDSTSGLHSPAYNPASAPKGYVACTATDQNGGTIRLQISTATKLKLIMSKFFTRVADYKMGFNVDHDGYVCNMDPSTWPATLYSKALLNHFECSLIPATPGQMLVFVTERHHTFGTLVATSLGGGPASARTWDDLKYLVDHGLFVP